MFEFLKKDKEKTENSETENRVPVIQFSNRLGNVFGKMYKYIFSVSLQQDVCQLECGETVMFGETVPERCRYSDMVNNIANHIHPDDLEPFLDAFNRENLAKSLSNGTNSRTGYYTFADPSGVNEKRSVFVRYYELRADRIPDNGSTAARCIVFVREVDSKFYKENRVLKREIKADIAGIHKDNIAEVRISTFFGGEDVTYFEYNVDKDELYLHDDPNDEYKYTKISNYARSIQARSDWTIYHSDIKRVIDAIDNSARGNRSEDIIKYRKNGEKTKKYRYHKLVIAPSRKFESNNWLIGSLKDVDEEVKRQNMRRDITSHMGDMLSSFFSNIYEIDIEKDIIYKVYYTSEGFVRAENYETFSNYVRSRIANGTIEESFADTYKKLLNPNYFEKLCVSGIYEFEAKLKLAGDLDYKWYADNIIKLSKGKKYLYVRKNINEMYIHHEKEYLNASQKKFNEYNQKMIDMIAGMVEYRNVEAGSHILNVRTVTGILLRDLAFRSPMYEITPKTIDLYTNAAIMHDIGKIMIPDSILNKTGLLTPEEREIMRSHTIKGAEIIDNMDIEGEEELLNCCREIALHHHERYDGNGYPHGLIGDQIPIGVQALSLADVYDALVSVRCYKDSFSFDEAYDMILNGECGAFNPRLLESFKARIDEINAHYEVQ